MCVNCVRVHCREAAGHQPTNFHVVSVWYSCVKPPLHHYGSIGVSSNDCFVWHEFQKQNIFWVSNKCFHELSDWLMHTKFLGLGIHCVSIAWTLVFVSGSWWWTLVSSPVIIIEKKFSVFALSLPKFSSLNCWRHAFYSGVAPVGNWPLTSSRLNGRYWKLCQLKCPVHEL